MKAVIFFYSSTYTVVKLSKYVKIVKVTRVHFFIRFAPMSGGGGRRGLSED